MAGSRNALEINDSPARGYHQAKRATTKAKTRIMSNPILKGSRLRLAGITILQILANSAAGDFLVPTYPAPTDLTSNHSQLACSWRNLTSIFDRHLGNEKPTKPTQYTGLDNITFSVGLFSLHDPSATQLQYHHTSPDVNASENGCHEVDENSIYRIASVSKLITTLAGLLLLSDEDWNCPLPDLISEFKQYLQKSNVSDPIWHVQWDKVTPWSLATQLSGIPTVRQAHTKMRFLSLDIYI